jgi:hypothetical protein
MRLVDQTERPEEHFTEGEPDLEAPEELALVELDEDTLLEEDLDNEDVAEDDVDDVVLTLTLEDLVHNGDHDEDDTASEEVRAQAPDDTGGLRTSFEPTSEGDGLPDLAHPERLGDEPDELEELDDLEVADLEDLDESLDRILAERTAGEEEPIDETDEKEEDSLPATIASAPLETGKKDPRTPTCREGEFLCPSCFLVRRRAQLADPVKGICRDCSG